VIIKQNKIVLLSVLVFFLSLIGMSLTVVTIANVWTRKAVYVNIVEKTWVQAQPKTITTSSKKLYSGNTFVIHDELSSGYTKIKIVKITDDKITLGITPCGMYIKHGNLHLSNNSSSESTEYWQVTVSLFDFGDVEEFEISAMVIGGNLTRTVAFSREPFEVVEN